MPRATALHLHRVEPGLVSQVLADTDLILPAKLALLYLLSHSQQIHTREDLAAVDPTVAERLDAVLHELASRLATVPAEEPPCLATRFRLRPHREEDDPDLVKRIPVRAALQLQRIEPGLVELVVADADLTLPSKLALLYVLGGSEQIHTREDLAAVDQLVASHLDAVLHELVGCNWLATVPAGRPPCLAARFRLREDQEVEDVDGTLGVRHLAAGVTWVPGDHGSDL